MSLELLRGTFTFSTACDHKRRIPINKLANPPAKSEAVFHSIDIPCLTVHAATN